MGENYLNKQPEVISSFHCLDIILLHISENIAEWQESNPDSKAFYTQMIDILYV